jgi:NADPH:quinone reductase-like Zn-dependent oxidoreductase
LLTALSTGCVKFYAAGLADFSQVGGGREGAPDHRQRVISGMMRAMKTMAQRKWTAGEPLELLDLPDPSPRPDEVRVRVAAIGVNPVDWKMRQRGPLRLAARVIGPPLPFVPGVDFAGTIDAVGARVTELKVGDRVVGGTDFSRGQRGSYAELVTARPDQLCVLPDNVSFEIAGALPVAGVTAWMSLMEVGRLASRGANPSVLVLGAAGGVGQFAVQLAKMQGARVVGVCSARNTELVRGLGADAVVDYTAGDALAQSKAHGPFDVILDCVGGYSGAGCRALLKSGGRHVMVSGESPAAVAQIFIPPFTSRTILGRSTTSRLRAVVDAVSSGKVRVSIAARFPLAEAEQAHTLSQSGRTTGKIVLLTQ